MAELVQGEKVHSDWFPERSKFSRPIFSQHAPHTSSITSIYSIL